jgi:hypothetical protein
VNIGLPGFSQPDRKARKTLSKKKNKQKTTTTKPSQSWWLTPVNPSTLEVEVGGSRSEASPGKSSNPYQKNKLK